MGCYNATCMLTSLPIVHGEEVYCFILSDVLNGKRRNFCTPSAEFRPLPLVIKGKYDDYGGIEDVEENLFTDWFLKEYDIGDGVDNTISRIQEGNVIISDNSMYEDGVEKKYTLQHVFIKKSIVDTILKDFEYFNYDLNTKEDKVNNHTTCIKKVTDLLIELDISESSLLGLSKSDLSNSDYDLKEFMATAKFVCSTSLKIELDFDLNFKFYTKLFETLNYNLISKALIDIATVNFINVFLTLGRNIWYPRSGLGSQSDSSSAQKMLFTAALKEIDNANGT